MMVVQCPYCGTSRDTHKEISDGTKFRCPFCRNVFRPPLADTPSPKADDPQFAAFVEAVLDELPTPPAMPPAEPSGLGLPDSNWFVLHRISPRLVASVLGVCILGLCAGFVCMYVHLGRGLDKLAGEGPDRKATKFKETSQDPPSLPELPAVQAPPEQAQAVPAQAQQELEPATPPVPEAPPSLAAPRPQVEDSLLQAAGPEADNGPVVITSRRPQRVVSDEDQKKAKRKIYQAQRLEKEGKVRLANKLYQEVLDNYPDTKAAEEAKKHAGFGLDRRVERAAKLLAMGQGFEMAHSVKEALDQYNKIVSAYPETEQAKTARERIKALSGYEK